MKSVRWSALRLGRQLMEASGAEAVKSARLGEVDGAGQGELLGAWGRIGWFQRRGHRLRLPRRQIDVGRGAGDHHQDGEPDRKQESSDHGKYWCTSGKMRLQFGLMLPPGP